MRFKVDFKKSEEFRERIRLKDKENYKKFVMSESIFMVKISWMNYYQEQENDYPIGDFDYIEELEYYDDIANISENQNFIVFGSKGILSKSYCFGFYQCHETKKGSGNYRMPRLENIEGNSRNKNCQSIDDVLVIFCATNPESEKNKTNIIGWYANAEIYKDVQYDNDFDLNYNIFAESKNCVLLPLNERKNNRVWSLPQIQGNGINFGQSTFIYPKRSNPELQNVLQKMANYDGENWCGKFS